MPLLDIIVGYYLPHFSGWIFLFFVLIIESILLSKYLTKGWNDKRIWTSVVVSNVITTLIGYMCFDREHSGGYLFNWIPVYEYHGEAYIYTAMTTFIASFIGSVLIESLCNIVLLKKQFTLKRILTGTLLVNVSTYAIGGVSILIYFIYFFHSFYLNNSIL